LFVEPTSKRFTVIWSEFQKRFKLGTGSSRFSGSIILAIDER